MVKTKKTMVVIIVNLTVALLSYFIYDDYSYNQRIFQDEIRSHIVKIVEDRARYKIYYFEKDKRTIKFEINEDIQFGYNNFFYNTTFNMEKPLATGDSVYKPANSLMLKVYKADANQEEPYKIFNGTN